MPAMLIAARGTVGSVSPPQQAREVRVPEPSGQQPPFSEGFVQLRHEPLRSSINSSATGTRRALLVAANLGLSSAFAFTAAERAARGAGGPVRRPTRRAGCPKSTTILRWSLRPVTTAYHPNAVLRTGCFDRSATRHSTRAPKFLRCSNSNPSGNPRPRCPPLSTSRRRSERWFPGRSRPPRPHHQPLAQTPVYWLLPSLETDQAPS